MDKARHYLSKYKNFIILIVVVIVSYKVGYKFGADLAEKHNARDAAERAASCDVDCE